ncbi:MAG: hypothetical protein KAR45_20045 [Desulfobacteraceae bacterium]|nr:hypothetical protein [Desulfobacteraceae bacterium]
MIEHDTKRFESRMEATIENLLKKITTKEKRVEIQNQLIKFQVEEIGKLKEKLYKKALLRLQRQSILKGRLESIK